VSASRSGLPPDARRSLRLGAVRESRGELGESKRDGQARTHKKREGEGMREGVTERRTGKEERRRERERARERETVDWSTYVALAGRGMPSGFRDTFRGTHGKL